jgi:molecular chaperone GrpE
MYNRNQPLHRGRRPQLSPAELHVALKRAMQENQQLRSAVAQEKQKRDDRNRLSAEVGALRKENAALSAALDVLRDARDEDRGAAALKDKALQLAADLANLQRRQDEELSRARRAARGALLRDFVASLDILEQALASNPDTDSPWHRGTAGVSRQMRETLQRAGVERLGAVGEPFDPYVHEAVGMDPTADVAPQHVAKVMQPGYRFEGVQTADALIRPARVIVSG